MQACVILQNRYDKPIRTTEKSPAEIGGTRDEMVIGSGTLVECQKIIDGMDKYYQLFFSRPKASF